MRTKVKCAPPSFRVLVGELRGGEVTQEGGGQSAVLDVRQPRRVRQLAGEALAERRPAGPRRVTSEESGLAVPAAPGYEGGAAPGYGGGKSPSSIGGCSTGCYALRFQLVSPVLNVAASANGVRLVDLRG